MKYYIITLLLLIDSLYVFAQQPRLKQVDKYLTITGNTVSVGTANEKRYCLLNLFYQAKKCLMLNLPESSDRGTREVIPFGYTLTPASEVDFCSVSDNLAESTVRPFYNKSLYSGVSYQFCDSVVYGITLYYDDPTKEKNALINKEMLAFFKRLDYLQADVCVYSDPDYAVKVFSDKVEVYSLFHYPVVESHYPGVLHKIWYGPYTYDTDNSSLMLAFYNQESKENNIQSAFKLHYRYNAENPFQMNRIRFVLDHTTYDFPLEIESVNVTDAGKEVEECDTRTFLYPEVLKAMERSDKIHIVLEGERGSLSYDMPAFQRASLHTAYEYFRWNVTNPMAKYRAW